MAPDNVQGNWENVYNTARRSPWPKEDAVVKANDGGVRIISLSSDLASLADSSDVDSFADRFRERVEKEAGRVA
jgi:hypothetical protein